MLAEGRFTIGHFFWVRTLYFVSLTNILGQVIAHEVLKLPFVVYPVQAFLGEFFLELYNPFPLLYFF